MFRVALLDALLVHDQHRELDAPFGPPPLVSRYGSVNRLAPVIVATITTRVVAGRNAGDGDVHEGA